VPKKWWLDPHGLPPAAERGRQRPLKHSVVLLYRVFFVVYPFMVAAVVVATSNIGLALLALHPILQFSLMPEVAAPTCR
jgi:hypothetical protein